MAQQPRGTPSVSENQDPRAREYFDQSIHRLLRFVGKVTTDIASIAAGAKATVAITVTGARPDKGQGVILGLPSAFNTSLLAWGYVSAKDTVTMVVYNPTGGAIDPPLATYAARVMP
jgi:hypothetical protein